MKEIKSELGLLLTAFIWGFGFIASQISLIYFTPYQVLFLRFTMAFLIMICLFWKKVKNIKVKTIKKAALVGVFLYGAFLLQIIGLKYTSASKNAFLTGINVILVPIISYFILKRKLRLREIIASILSVIGISILSFTNFSNINIGDILTILCAVAFALHIITTDIYVENEDPIEFTIVQMGTCAILGFVSTVFLSLEFKPINTEAIFVILYLGIVSTMIAYMLQTSCQKNVSETKSAVLLSTESLFGPILAFIILNEEVTYKTVFGGIIIFISIIIASIPSKNKDIKL